MKILFVSPSFYPAFHYGGPIFINRSFCDIMAGVEDVKVRVLTTDSNGPGKRLDVYAAIANHKERYSIKYCLRTFPPDISLGLLVRLIGEISHADVVLLNGVYSFTTIPTLFLCRVMNKPMIWSTMGALQRWPGSTRQKLKRVWEKICNCLCQPARVVMHVTSEEERVESLEKIQNASAMILRNGIYLPHLGRVTDKVRSGALRLLFLGRLHPIKGIENLLRAVAQAKTEVRLSICGEGNSEYEDRLRTMVNELGLTGVIEFCGRVDGELKEQHFRESDLCVAPSFKEAFCTVALESMARAVPVIVGHGIPWRRVEEVGCGLWVSNEPAELAAAIDRAATMPLTEMGRRGRAWMEREYSWQPVAEEMIDICRSLASNRAFSQKVPAPTASEANVS
jgi:glycosyltransferase involved in cell wall biosynthesis